MPVDVEVVKRAVRTVEGTVRVVVQAKPRSKVEGIEAGRDGGLVVRVRAPPVEGAANERIIEVLAGILGVRRSALTLVRGETARHKELAVSGLTLADVIARLAAS